MRNHLLLLATVAGCASYSANDQATAADTSHDGATTATQDTGTDLPVVEPTHYSIGGVLEVVDGEADVTSELVFTVLAPDPPPDTTADTWDGNPCATYPTIDAAVPASHSFDADLFGWWEITTATDDACPTTPAIPARFHLGIGAYDRQLDPAAAAAHLDGAQRYGLYIQLDAEASLLVFGVAGTAAQLDGSEPPAVAAPLPDGSYTLQSLFLLPLDAP